MTKRKKKKKINMTIPEWLYDGIQKKAKDEYLPMATYSRKLLIDSFRKNNIIEKNGK